MSEIERAIEHYEYGISHDIFSEPVTTYARLAVEALRAQAEREKGCEICNGKLPCDNGCDGFCDICDIPDVWKTIHKTGQYNFCPICGRKLPKEGKKV